MTHVYDSLTLAFPVNKLGLPLAEVPVILMQMTRMKVREY
jgi:hypothetical protein